MTLNGLVGALGTLDDGALGTLDDGALGTLDGIDVDGSARDTSEGIDGEAGTDGVGNDTAVGIDAGGAPACARCAVIGGA